MIIPVLIISVLIISMPAAASAAETADISPYIILNLSGVPDGIFDGGEIGLIVSSVLSDETISLLKGLDDFSVANAAYAVNITVQKLNLSDVSDCSVYLPVSHKWNSGNNPVRAVVICGDDVSVETLSLEGGNETVSDVYSLKLSEVPDMVILVYSKSDVIETSVPTTAVPTPEPTASPAAVSVLIFGLASAFIIRRIER
ncbi:MAG: hypothetical protein Q4Q53_02975 [Methanocorpusculum sp.]|nr:hypothetical protein [Methanocorpusculum sp.]